MYDILACVRCKNDNKNCNLRKKHRQVTVTSNDTKVPTVFKIGIRENVDRCHISSALKS